MITDLPKTNIYGACQVAHALSTHKVSVEFDYYTAVDDLAPREEPGAGMLGTVEFNSACFYRYANVNLAKLRENLQGDGELAGAAVSAFVRAAVLAIPTGKQNSMAAHNPPSLVFGLLREHGLWSLANAFVRPVEPTPQESLVAASIRALDTYWGRLVAVYGADGLREQAVVCLEPESDVTLAYLGPHRVPTLSAFLDRLRQGSEAVLAGHAS
jgi:CRISPR system Cascade subunit CasC